MYKFRHERFTPAFILLLLVEEQACGMDILKKMELLIPGNRNDSAIIYRSLKTLEKEGMVTFEWHTPEAGPAKKNYTITEKGLEALEIHRNDVEQRIKSLTFFMDSYDRLKPGKALK